VKSAVVRFRAESAGTAVGALATISHRGTRATTFCGYCFTPNSRFGGRANAVAERSDFLRDAVAIRAKEAADRMRAGAAV